MCAQQHFFTAQVRFWQLQQITADPPGASQVATHPRINQSQVLFY
jgi:hypothetical protein